VIVCLALLCANDATAAEKQRRCLLARAVARLKATAADKRRLAILTATIQQNPTNKSLLSLYALRRGNLLQYHDDLMLVVP
jgi:hypothetical protein